ncbi:MAG: hypothetical protein R3B54_03940 [Bdellovibrionota bacterium]
MKRFEIPGFEKEEKELNASYSRAAAAVDCKRKSLGLLHNTELRLYEREFEAGRFTPLPWISWLGRTLIQAFPQIKYRIKG